MNVEVIESKMHNGTDPEAAHDGQLEPRNGETKKVAKLDDYRPSDFGTQANLLLKLIDEFKSITDQAFDTATREAERADEIRKSKGTELDNLQLQLTEKEASIRSRDAALKNLEATTAGRIADLESRLAQKDRELENKAKELENAKAQVQDLLNRLYQSELALRETEARIPQATERLETAIAEMKTQLEQREESLRAKDSIRQETEENQSRQIEELRLELQESRAQLASRDNELAEKTVLIRAAAEKENEISKLIQHLSSECKRLSGELHDKKLQLARWERDEWRSIGGGNKFKKVFGL